MNANDGSSTIDGEALATLQAQTAARSLKRQNEKDQLSAASSYVVIHESPEQHSHCASEGKYG